jgi:FkbM family methyltransferase
MISYAGNFEDVVLERVFRGINRGFYIDVGAYEPIDQSVTHHFYLKGWNGINIEPNPAPFRALAAARDRDVNLNVGLSNHEGSIRVFSADGACWSVDRGLITGWFGVPADKIVERVMPVRTLAAICERHAPQDAAIEFLKIDVEGHEREVVEGGDWNRWRPRVVLIEADRPEAWEPRLLDAGYVFALFDGVNRFYVRDEDRRLLPIVAAPANATDNFLIHAYLKNVPELEERLAILGGLGPNAVRMAHRFHRASENHPKFAKFVRPVLKRLLR